MFVKPKKGFLIRDPITKTFLPATGREVPQNPFWMRRLQAGDITIARKPRKKKGVSRGRKS